MSDVPIATWNMLEDAIAKFQSFLVTVTEVTTLNDWHVVFTMGTVVRLSLSDPEFKEYSGEYWSEYPTYRLSSDDDMDNIIATNVKIWNEQKNKLKDDPGKALRIAYNTLITDGYPHPGGEGSDRTPIPMEDPDNDDDDFLWMIIWERRDRYITNMAIAKNPGSAAMNGGECRRYDAVSPKVAAVIAPDLTIYRV